MGKKVGVDNVDVVDGVNEIDPEAVFDSAVSDELPAGDELPASDELPVGDELPAGDELPDTLTTTVEKLEKRLKDTQAWDMAITRENADLKKRLAELENKKPVAQDPLDDPPDHIKEYYANDPGLKDVIAYEAARLVKERFGDFDPSALASRVSNTQEMTEQANFERAVLYGVMTPTGFVKGHPDALEVMASKEYQNWFSIESSKDTSLAAVNSPIQAIGVMDRYKASVAEAAAQKTKTAQDPKAENLKSMMTGAVETGTKVSPKRAKSPGEESPEEAFNRGSK